MKKEGAKGALPPQPTRFPAPSDSDAKKGEETTKAVKKFPFPFKKSASGPSKAKEEEEKPHAASEDEIEYISTAIMAHHGLAKGMPIASQAIVHMENINKALGEEIPNVKKAKEELQSLLNTLCLPEEKGKSTLEATTARIHEVEVAYKVLIDLDLCIKDMEEAIIDCNNDKFNDGFALFIDLPKSIKNELAQALSPIIKERKKIQFEIIHEIRKEKGELEIKINTLQGIIHKLESSGTHTSNEIEKAKRKQEEFKVEFIKNPEYEKFAIDQLDTLDLFNYYLNAPIKKKPINNV